MEISEKPLISEETYISESYANRRAIIGLDISLRSTGYCILVDDKDTCGVFSPVSKDEFSKKMDIAINVKSSIIDRLGGEIFKPVAFIEGYSFGSQHRGQAIAELTGLIKSHLWHADIRTYIVPPTVLKKFITSRGNSDKNIMLMKILKKYGREFFDDNEADAYALAKLGEYLLNNPENELWKKVELLC